LKVLDAGAGPLSTMGTHCGETPVELIPVDVLAPMYDALLAKLSIEPRVRTQYAPMEEVATRYAPNFFDLVTTFNALDHAQDPVEAVNQMVRVVKPGHYLNIFVMVNESTYEHGFGMHKWNLFADARDHFFIADHAYTKVTDVTEMLRQVATVSYEYQDTTVHPHTTINPAQCRAAWVKRKCAIMVRIKKLLTGGSSKAGGKTSGHKSHGDHTHHKKSKSKD